MKNFLRVVLCGLLCASLPLPATSADGVEIYGLLSAGIVHLRETASMTAPGDVTSLADQAHNSNRWGLRGSEDLGGGLTATFNLESSLSIRSGAAGRDATYVNPTGNPLFDREANVALESRPWGRLKIGRGKNLLYEVLDEFDARSNWNFAGLKPVARYAGFYGGSNVARFDNMVRYSSPRLGGLMFDAAYSIGGYPGDTERQSHWVAGATYQAGAAEFAYVHGELRLTCTVLNCVTVQSGENVTERIDLLAAKYRWADWRLHAGYARTRNPQQNGTNFNASATRVDGRTSADTWFVGTRYEAGPSMAFTASYYDVSDKATAGGIDSLRVAAVGLIYRFSKRTELFADYAKAFRRDGAVAPFTLYDRMSFDGTTGSESIASQSGVVLGVQHRF